MDISSGDDSDTSDQSKMEIDLVAAMDTSSKHKTEENPPSDCDHEEQIVWPWKGIVANIPTQKAADGRSVGQSGSKLRDELIRRGFNPIRVIPLWNYLGHSGTAIVEFNKDWPGLQKALSFEKAYEADDHGKKDWIFANKNDGFKSGLYAWVARADDYKSSSLIGEHLRKTGNLKTVSEIMEEENRKQETLVSDLTNIFETKNKHAMELKTLCSENFKFLEVAMQEKDKLLQSYNEEIVKRQQSAWEYSQRMLNDHMKLKSQIETFDNELELRRVELEKRQAMNESERNKLAEELKQVQLCFAHDIFTFSLLKFYVQS
ncbi:hypothetical protein COLO4_32992 [Corchorus olitorius]|uniref:XS domain-containing protein n=1 Tax=Corchorus olitorius TaxID=93759 RepID=A0A1R3GWX2_9ROSI|nr:hypothetical protein COLO4_32992 [Corchorus olitorius]